MKKILLLSVYVLLLGCEQSVDPFDLYKPTPKDLLTGGPWRSQSVTLTPSGLNACEQDNIFTFQKSGNLIIDLGIKKCNSSDPQTFNATWSLNAANTEIAVEGWNWGAAPDIWIIDILEENKFTARINFTFSGTKYTVTYALVRG